MLAPTLGLVLTIVGGEPAPSPSDDAVVCLAADGFPLCSGVLVGPRSVLTAGHCIDALGPHATYRVHVGPDCNAPARRMTTVLRLTHPQYAGEGKPFDVGYLSLAEDAPVAPLPLADGALETLAPPGTSIRHVGYGGTDEGGGLSGMGTRRAVLHPVLRLDGDFAWSGDAAANTCLVDSGAPMLGAGNAVLALVSDGPSCREAGADVRLDRVRTWVDERLRAESPESPMPTPPGGCSTAPDMPGLVAAWALWRAWGATRRRHLPTMGKLQHTHSRSSPCPSAPQHPPCTAPPPRS